MRRQIYNKTQSKILIEQSTITSDTLTGHCRKRAKARHFQILNAKHEHLFKMLYSFAIKRLYRQILVFVHFKICIHSW